MHAKHGLILAFALGVMVSLPARGDFLAASNNGDIWNIDAASGAATLLYSSTKDWPLNALAVNRAGVYFGSGDSVSSLVSIDPSTGQSTLLRTVDGLKSIRGLAFSGQNVLYGIEDGGAISGNFQPDWLYTINPATGASAVVGSVGFRRVQGLAFSPDGTLFGWDDSYGLLRIDPATGATVDVNGASDGTAYIQTLAFAPDGKLYGARNGLFEINPLTGQYGAGVGQLSDIRGMEWRVVPEPAALLVVAGGGLLLCRRRGRREG